MNVFNTSKQCASTSRDNTLDIIAGILIARMILGHYLSMCNLQETFLSESLNVLYFYMPWFFFKSGMFCSTEKKDTKDFFVKNCNKFLTPFISFAFIGFLFGIFSAIITDTSITVVLKSEIRDILFSGSTTWNAPVWFLLSLCLVRIIYNFIRKYINSYCIIGLCLVLAYLHFLFLSNFGVRWFGNVMSGLLFYVCGKEFKNLQYNKYIFAVSFVIVCVISTCKPTIVYMYGNVLKYDNGYYLLWYPYCLSGIVVMNNLIKHIGKVLDHYNFSNIGQYSMVYYLIHYPIGLFICSIYYHYSNQPNNWELLTYLCLFWLGALPLLVHLFNSTKLSKLIGK